MTPSNKQLNIRLSPPVRDTLDAAAYVKRTTPSLLAREALEEAIKRYAKEAPVQAALRALQEEDAANEGKVTRISKARGKRRKK